MRKIGFHLRFHKLERLRERMLENKTANLTVLPLE